MYRVTAHWTAGDVSTRTVQRRIPTLATALRVAHRLIAGIPDAYADVRRAGEDGNRAELSNDWRGRLHEAEVLVPTAGGRLVTPLNPRGPLFRA